MKFTHQIMKDFQSEKIGSFENEAFENEDRSTKHPNLGNEAPSIENEAPTTGKQRPLNLENEAPKTRNHCRSNNYNFTSCITQSESGGGSRCVRTSKGPQNPSQGFIKACQLFNWTFPERISCIILLLVSLYLIHLILLCIFSVHIHAYVDFKTVRQQTWYPLFRPRSKVQCLLSRAFINLNQMFSKS